MFRIQHRSESHSAYERAAKDESYEAVSTFRRILKLLVIWEWLISELFSKRMHDARSSDISDHLKLRHQHTE